MIAANSLASRSISRKLKSPQVRRHGPDDDDVHTLCPSCGQLYRNADIERDGEAPIIDTVDVGVTAFLVSLRRREIAPIEHDASIWCTGRTDARAMRPARRKGAAKRWLGQLTSV
ncbi:hypothetical protein [Arthrobacter oryzae]|uniref:hypothetical protein n=1 Tax=Arthrobacter oryzae TaxID=409290 RepID=UPI0028602177|nr:hypothetical protein [Arthrobacter oryzae]MDR6508054.1 hypothetical protein [Arthrobacter oryzae]